MPGTRTAVHLPITSNGVDNYLRRWGDRFSTASYFILEL